MPFKKKKGTVSPVNILREYVSTYMYWVKTGKEKFRHKKEIGPIFAEMESARYLFEQALSGTVYDYQKKLERNVWAAAMHKYGEEMDKLKDALQRAVEDCEAAKSDEEKEAAARAKEEAEKRKQEEEKLSLKEQMALAEQRELEEEEDEQEESLEEEIAAGAGETMTEADCKELWRIYQGMNREYKQMKKTADRWIEENPEEGCLGVTLMLLLAPLAAVYGLFQIL